MHPLGTEVYPLKRYSPSDSFCTFFSESVKKSVKFCSRISDFEFEYDCFYLFRKPIYFRKS